MLRQTWLVWYTKRKLQIAIKCDPETASVYTPRNLKQLRNLRFQHLQQTRISQDTLYNLHEIAYDIPKITTYPDLLCICGLKEMLSEFDRVLLLEFNFQLVSYDTTFQLGDFYISPLVFRHTLFKENPCWVLLKSRTGRDHRGMPRYVAYMLI